MATYTLTFASDVDVTVDGKTVTSPYTLTKSCTINVSTMVNPNSNYYISMNGMEVLSETVSFADEDLHIYANTSSTGRTLALNAVVNFTISAPPKVSIDVTTLSGYESLAAGTYQLAVRAKATGYTDSDLSQTVSFTKLAAPTITASDTTVTWDAVTNADSYDVYVDGELYENTTGGYDITVNVTNGTYSGDTTITDTATVTITADSGYTLPDTVTVTGASQTWNKETGILTLSNPTGAVTVTGECIIAKVIVKAGTYRWIDNPVMPEGRTAASKPFVFTSGGANCGALWIGGPERDYDDQGIVYNVTGTGWKNIYRSSWIDGEKYKEITVNEDQEIEDGAFWWSLIFGNGNLVKQ